MTKQLEALKPQAFELLIANGYEMANQLRHLANNEIDSDSFAVVTENYNGIETEFERSITELALQAAGTFDALIEALEQSQQHKGKDFEIKARLCRESNSLHDRLKVAEKRIAELEARPVSVPDEKELPELLLSDYHESVGWNDAIREVRRMNTGVSALAVKLPADSIDYKALVLQIAEIAHGGPVDIGLLPVTVRSMQQICAAPQMPGWISVDAELPDPGDARRVCAYTPSEYGDFQYRSVPASLFKSVCRQATHWHYFTVPETAIAAAQKPEAAVKK